MVKKDEKQFALAILFILVLFLSSLLVAYFHFKDKDQVEKDKNVSTKFQSSSTINIKSILPISDELGKKLDGKGTEEGVQGYLEFSIKNEHNKDMNYEIFITEKDLKEEIRANYIKFYLTDNVDNPLKGYEKNLIPSAADLLSLTDKPESKLLYKDTIKKKSSKKFKLRVWLADTYVVSDDENEYTFSVGVRSY